MSMFSYKTKSADASAMSPDALKAYLESILPPSLLEAERRVSDLRDKREATARELVNLSRSLDKERTHERKPGGHEVALTTRLASIDADLRVARTTLREQREQAARVIPKAVASQLRLIAPELEMIAAAFESFAELLQVPDSVAMRHGLTAPGLALALNDIPQLSRLAKLFSEAK